MHHQTRDVACGTGVSHAARAVAPGAWSGDAECDVGPFCCEDTATRFASPPVDFGAYETLELRPMQCEGIWYVRVTGRPTAHVCGNARTSSA